MQPHLEVSGFHTFVTAWEDRYTDRVTPIRKSEMLQTPKLTSQVVYGNNSKMTEYRM